jgi:hypothetical protein
MKIVNLILTVTTLVARNKNVTTVAHMVGSDGVCVWRESGDKRLVLFGGNLASVAVKIFLHLI